MSIHRFAQSIEDFFFPTARNRMCPHGLSRIAFLAYLFVGAALAASSIYWKASHLATPLDIVTFRAEEVIALVNESRKAAGLETLVYQQTLERAAQRKAADMFTRQYFAHATPTNELPWVFFKNEGYSYQAAGENLAIDFSNAFDAHRAFMASEGHRANILSPLYKEIGIAVLPGEFQGRSSIIVVQFFGAPKASVVAASLPSAPIVSAKQSLPAIEESLLVAPKRLLSVPTLSSPSREPLSHNEELTVQKTPAVLKEVTESESLFATFSKETGPGYQLEVRILAFVVIALMAIPALFMIVRTGFWHARVLVRPAVIIGLFVFLGWFGGFVEPVPPSLTVTAESTIQQDL